MIVVDSSAIIAILEKEPEQQAFEDIIAGEDRCLISAVNVHETAIVLRATVRMAARQAIVDAAVQGGGQAMHHAGHQVCIADSALAWAWLI